MPRTTGFKRCSLIAIVLLGGCAAHPPASISKVPADNPSLLRVRMNIDSFIGREVRWGGVISKVENRAEQTWVELVRRNLREDGRPLSGGSSDGRFIASFAGFIDPVDYKVGSLLTVVGRIDAKTQRSIGEYEYSFPIVTVEGSHLWRSEPVIRGPYYPPPPWFYYDVHYYHRYPFHRHPRFR